MLSSIQQKDERKGNEVNVKRVDSYKATIEAELRQLCQQILDLLDQTLISSASTAEAKVFYFKMKGDYFRYISEFA